MHAVKPADGFSIHENTFAMHGADAVLLAEANGGGRFGALLHPHALDSGGGGFLDDSFGLRGRHDDEQAIHRLR